MGALAYQREIAVTRSPGRLRSASAAARQVASGWAPAWSGRLAPMAIRIIYASTTAIHARRLQPGIGHRLPASNVLL